MQQYFFPDLGKEKLCSILVFGNVCFNILRVVVRINHDNVASRGAVGRTHTIVRLETRIRRKDGTEDFGGFVCVLDGFPQPDFVLWVFMCPINFILFSGYHAEGYHAPPLFPATTPRATTPHRSFAGYHAEGYHTRTDEFKIRGYHVCRVTTPELPRSI